jgi:hypothetical protein
MSMCDSEVKMLMDSHIQFTVTDNELNIIILRHDSDMHL